MGCCERKGALKAEESSSGEKLEKKRNLCLCLFFFFCIKREEQAEGRLNYKE